MNPTRRLWQGLAIVFVLSFAALGWLGREIYLAAPPIPQSVLSETGALLYSGEQIRDGQRAWLAAGVPGDLVFALGALFLALYAAKLLAGGRRLALEVQLETVK